VVVVDGDTLVRAGPRVVVDSDASFDAGDRLARSGARALVALCAFVVVDEAARAAVIGLVEGCGRAAEPAGTRTRAAVVPLVELVGAGSPPTFSIVGSSSE
jgi:hypothetical protein